MGTELDLTPKVTYVPSGPIDHSHASIHLTFMENLPCARYCSVFTESLRNLNKKFLSSGHLLLVKSEEAKKVCHWMGKLHPSVWCDRH